MKNEVDFESGRLVIFSYDFVEGIENFEHGSKLFEVYYFTKTFENENTVGQFFLDYNDLIIFEIEKIVNDNKEIYNHFDIEYKLLGNTVSTNRYEIYNKSYCSEYSKFIQLKFKSLSN